MFFDPTTFSYPTGFPKGLTKDTTPKVIVQRVFAPASPHYALRDGRRSTRRRTARSTRRTSPGSPPATTTRRTARSSCPASRRTRYLGNYKALTIPTPGFGLDGNSAQIAAAIEAAVVGRDERDQPLARRARDLAERDFVVHAIDAAAQAGVVPVIAADNQFDEYGYGSISSPANAPAAITVAATTLGGHDRGLLVGRPHPGLAAAEAGRRAPRASRSPRRCR